jgi:hypothetical protein
MLQNVVDERGNNKQATHSKGKILAWLRMKNIMTLWRNKASAFLSELWQNAFINKQLFLGFREVEQQSCEEEEKKKSPWMITS